MTVVHLTAKSDGKKREIVSIETYAPAAPPPPKEKVKAAPKAAPKPAPKGAKGNKSSK
jgi:hypothetical protein